RNKGRRGFRRQLCARAAQRTRPAHALRPGHRDPAVDHGRHADHRVPHRRDDRGGREVPGPARRPGARPRRGPGHGLLERVFLDELFDLDEIRVTSRRPESREAFAQQLAGLTSTPVRVTASSDEAFDGADILVEASRLTQPQPLLRTSAVRPGAFVVPYGTISAVELDLLDVMDKVVVDDWREAQSGRFGALRRHVDTGRLTAESLYAELGQIVAGDKPGRERDDERILLWHRGLAILDIAVGLAILRRAEEQAAGTMLRYR